MKESVEVAENQAGDILEEETIYSKNLAYKDSIIMNDFQNSWEEKWVFAEKFMDNRLKYFAAKHILEISKIFTKKYFIIF